MSLFLLLSFIDFDIIPILIIILLGIVSFLFDYLAEKEFKSGFAFLNNISSRAHKNVKKFWNLAKSIMFILIYEIVGVDVIALFFKTEGIEEKELLFHAAIFAGGIASIATLVSSRLKELFGEKYKRYTSFAHGYSISIPDYWEGIDVITDSVAIKGFCDKISDNWCYIFKDKKMNYSNEATMDDFASLQVENFTNIDSAVIKCSSDEEYKSKKFVGHNVCIHKKKYQVFQFFVENRYCYYEVRIVVPNESLVKKEYLQIIESFKVQ